MMGLLDIRLVSFDFKYEFSQKGRACRSVLGALHRLFDIGISDNIC